MRISEHVYAIKIPFRVPISPVTSLERFVYAFAIVGTDITLIDSGTAGADRLIFDEVRHAGRSAGEIARIVLTHSHPDHIGAARAIRQLTACAVAAHSAEKAWIENVELQCRQRPVPGFGLLVGGSVPVDRVLADGDILDLPGGLPLRAMHTPGHSAGSISLRLEADNVVFCGDAVPLPGDLPIWEDPAAVIRSLERLRAIEDVRWLLSAWDAPRPASDVRPTIDRSIEYVRRVQAAVRQAAGRIDSTDPMSLCRRVVAEIGLPPAAANPLVARSLAACL